MIPARAWWGGLIIAAGMLLAGCATCAHHPRYERALCEAFDGYQTAPLTEHRSHGWLLTSRGCCLPR